MRVEGGTERTEHDQQGLVIDGRAVVHHPAKDSKKTNGDQRRQRLGETAVCRRLRDAPTVDVLEFKLGGLEEAGTAVPASRLERAGQ